ncbi:F-box/FBD/LRR-repeat protein At1g13570-like isoform X2 [Solanum stenotomum]|uniref:F-box/FBD/LRR-repeat protein At1g13570-like isoform X2 n=1 Tax=Solanum stenotomum TaxID=172797 RepID=UPI0020D09B4F|nr:F-box/FBD/LRR-repeat protein At1g13570-like isoform X2 [Solanum stenotomum]
MMPPKAIKHRRSLLPDALSYLPDNVIDVILLRLPCEDAVRTSILSKKWRNHWCRLTELKIDESLWKTEKDLLNPTVKFTKIMYQLLSLHEGPITKFTLYVVHLASCPEIDNFIYFLSRNDIQHLVLDLSLGKEYKLPSSLFTCSQLRHLSLCYCSIQHPSAFHGFDKLISLKLCEVNISSELLESLISHCPLLEELELDIEDQSDTIEINAPMLRLFNLSGNISSVCLKNVPRLVKVLLYGDYIKAEDLDFAKLFECCPALEHLLFFSFGSEVHCGDEEDGCILECLELGRFSDVTLNHLREVKLECFGGTTMQLIKLLLAMSPVLVRMLIDTCVLDDEPLDTRLIYLLRYQNFCVHHLKQ